MTLKYYFDLMSQPSRAVYIFLKLSKIPFEACPVALRKAEHLSEEFKEKYSKFQKVPFIHDGNFKLAESIAIVRYLNNEHKIPEYLYPKNSKHQAKVDEYLEWQHHNLRAFCSLYFRLKFVEPLLTGEQPPEDKVQKFRENMIDSIDKLQELFLDGSQYIAGGNQISFADILAACELEQPRMVGYDPLEGRPILKAWMERVRKECSPFYNEAHQILNKIASSSKSKL